jgi:hypothetical protein
MDGINSIKMRDKWFLMHISLNGINLSHASVVGNGIDCNANAKYTYVCIFLWKNINLNRKVKCREINGRGEAN